MMKTFFLPVLILWICFPENITSHGYVCQRDILYMKWVKFRMGKFTLLYLADECQNWFGFKSFSTDSLKLLKNMQNIY